jgi:hypothetical protein
MQSGAPVKACAVLWMRPEAPRGRPADPRPPRPRRRGGPVAIPGLWCPADRWGRSDRQCRAQSLSTNFLRRGDRATQPAHRAERQKVCREPAGQPRLLLHGALTWDGLSTPALSQECSSRSRDRCEQVGIWDRRSTMLLSADRDRTSVPMCKLLHGRSLRVWRRRPIPPTIHGTRENGPAVSC